MASPYRRRRPALIRTFWVYRHLVAAAFVLGVLLWFVVINRDPVDVHFPFGLGVIHSTSGVLILMSGLVGALAASLALGVVFTVWRLKSGPRDAELDDGTVLEGDRPPADYAAKSEPFDPTRWSPPSGRSET